MGKLQEAASEFTKALQTADLSFSLQHMDLPSLYATADAYAGMGDVAMAEAVKASNESERAKLHEEARSSYESSLNVWKRIPNPSKISGNEYAVGSSQQVTLRLAALATQVR
jgi:hypothetical protein